MFWFYSHAGKENYLGLNGNVIVCSVWPEMNSFTPSRKSMLI